MGRSLEPRDVVARQIVDRGLVLLERGDVLFQAAPRAGRPGGLEAAERQQLLAALEILVDPFLQDAAEVVPDLQVRLGLLLGELPEFTEQATRQALRDRG